MKLKRFRKFNTRDVYPGGKLDNDVCMTVKAGNRIFLRGQTGLDLDQRMVNPTDAAAQAAADAAAQAAADAAAEAADVDAPKRHSGKAGLKARLAFVGAGNDDVSAAGDRSLEAKVSDSLLGFSRQGETKA